MNKPLVSIIVPAYNHEMYIDDLIKSLIDQTYQHIELFILDDKSNDQTFQRLLGWQTLLEERFVSVSICRNSENLGVVKTLNKLLRMCNGKYIKIIASDDFLFSDTIESLVHYFENNQSFGIIYTNAICCNSHTRYPMENMQDSMKWYHRIPPSGMNLTQQLYEHNFILAPTVFYKRTTINKIGFYDENITIEDWEYWLRVSLHESIGYFDKITVAYRILNTSLSHFSSDDSGRKRMKNMFHCEMQIVEKYKSVLGAGSKSGVRKFIQRNLHSAIDIEYDDMIKVIFKYIKKNKVKISIEVRVKHLFYKLNLLKKLQKLKRKLGLETAILYDESKS